MEEEFDLRDLFKIIWAKKLIVILFTSIITLSMLIYVNLKKPIYEVKSVVKIGHINNILLENKKVLIQKLKLIYNVGNNKKTLNKDVKAIVSAIEPIKDLNNFVVIYTQAYSNPEALKLNNHVINYIKNEYKYKIDSFILKTNTSIKNLQLSIKNIEVFEKEKINRDIKKLKEQTIVKLDDRIKFYQNVEIKSINDKINFYNKKFVEYEKNIEMLVKKTTSNNTNAILKNIQLSNIQSLVLDIQNKISDLKKSRKEILQINIKKLKIEKEYILMENLRDLENKLLVRIPNKINKLKDSIVLEELKLENFENTILVGEQVLNSKPINSEKTLRVLVSFILSLIFSIFFVLFYYFIKRQ